MCCAVSSILEILDFVVFPSISNLASVMTMHALLADLAMVYSRDSDLSESVMFVSRSPSMLPWRASKVELFCACLVPIRVAAAVCFCVFVLFVRKQYEVNPCFEEPMGGNEAARANAHEDERQREAESERE